MCLPQPSHAAVGRTSAAGRGSLAQRPTVLGLVAQRWLLIQRRPMKLSPLRNGRTWANALGCVGRREVLTARAQAR
eukprot:2272915-Pyramimonas_sp.AAC.1